MLCMAGADRSPFFMRVPAFFSLRDIEPLEELTYDYGYADVPGKTVPCLCGAVKCQKLLY